MREFESVRFTQSVTVAGVHTTWASVRDGFTITADGPLVTVKKGEAETLVPWANVVFAVALPKPEGKKK